MGYSVGNFRHKNLVSGELWCQRTQKFPNSSTFRHVADLSPTCRRHSQLSLPTQLLLPLPFPLPPPYQSPSFCHHCMLLLLVSVFLAALPIGIPRMQQARTISFFMMVTHLLCIAHKLVSLKTSTMKYSAASWRARTAVLCIRRSLFPNFSAILCTRRWKGVFLMRRSVFFWNFWISLRATIPGRQR